MCQSYEHGSGNKLYKPCFVYWQIYNKMMKYKNRLAHSCVYLLIRLKIHAKKAEIHFVC